MGNPTSCLCGWRVESPDTHPHVSGCEWAAVMREREDDRAAIRALEHAADCVRAYFQALKGWQDEQSGYTAQVMTEMKGRVTKALWSVEDHRETIARAQGTSHE